MLAGGRKQSLGKETGEWDDRWVLAARQDGAPDTRRGGAHQRHADGSGPHLGVCDIYRLRYYRNCCFNDVQFDNI